MSDRPLPQLTSEEYEVAKRALTDLDATSRRVPPEKRSDQFKEAWEQVEHLRVTLAAAVEGYEAPGDASDPRDAGTS
jgi:hypothetical protein